MNPLNTNLNKATWSTAVNALIVLINGRLPEALALSVDEQGYLMTIVTFLVVYFVKNKEA